MKRLLQLELKRVLKKRQTLVIFSLSIFFTFFLAYILVTFENTVYSDEAGNKTVLKGLDAIRYEKKLQKDIVGIITPEILKFAVEESQKCLREYGVESPYDLSDEVYSERIKPYASLINGVRQIFVDPTTGFALSDLQIDPEKINNDFYDRCEKRLAQVMEMEQKDYPVIQLVAANMYKKVEKPFVFYGENGNALDYQLFLSLIIFISCIVLVAPIFSSDYQTGAEDILRCTKYGGVRLGIIKIISSISICTVLYLTCMTVYILISNSFFGWECTKTSMQMVYFPFSLANWNIGQQQWAMVFAGLLSVIATASFTLFLSSKNKNVIVPLVIGLIICVLPIIIYFPLKMLPENIGLWIQALLPSGGAGIVGSFFEATIDLMFLRIGNSAIWLPYVMVVFASIELLFFIALIIYSYNQYKEY